MIKLLVVNSTRETAIPFYRSSLPFLKLREEIKDLEITKCYFEDVKFNWDEILQYDAVFLSNPVSNRHLDIIRVFIQYNKKAWIDFDDDYLHLHEIKNAVPAHIALLTETTKYVKECIKLASEITVSVEYLKDVIKQVTDKQVTVIPNAFPTDLINNIVIRQPKPGIHNFITWRGKNNLHSKNLRAFRDPMTQVGQKHKDWKFLFFGNPIDDDDFFPAGFNFEHFHPTSDIFRNTERMQEKFAKIHIVPMIDSSFNHSKSMISWMEATLNGSAVLAPSWLEWQRPGIINYHNKEEFKILLNEMIEEKHNLQDCFEKSYNYIINNLSLKIINKERIKVLTRLLA